LIAGNFDTLNGVNKRLIARLNTDGSLDNSFNTSGFGSYDQVNKIDIRSDGKVFLGGYFDWMAGNLILINSDGSLDSSFNFTLWTHGIIAIQEQTDGKILASYFLGAVNFLIRVNTDGSVDNTFMLDTLVEGFYDVIAIQPDGKILTGGAWTVDVNPIVRLNSDGSLDNTFNLVSGGFYHIYTIVVKSDGKILIGGEFTPFGNQNHFTQINPDGSIDNSFKTQGADYEIEAVKVQPDGKILIAGYLNIFNSTPVNHLCRLNPGGDVDLSLNIGSGPNNSINAMDLQPDGKILIGGYFTFFNGSPLSGLARLDQNGSVDNTFNTGSDSNVFINTITLDVTGKILIGGSFNSFNGSAVKNLARLNQNGSIDNTFNIGSGLDNIINAIALQADGKILIGGYFTSFNGSAAHNILRLNVDGSIDSTFNVGSGPNSQVNAITIQSDGKILIGGYFTLFNGFSINNLARLNHDGSIDNSFIPVFGNININVMLAQNDGKILTGGQDYFSRLNTDGSIDNSFKIDSGGVLGSVLSIAMQSNGDIIAAGGFTIFNQVEYNHIFRLHGENHNNIIRGNIFSDKNNDCKIQSSENPLSSVVVKALPGPFYGGSDAYGDYQIRVDSGTVNYALTQEFNSINSKILVNQCASLQTVSLTGVAKDTCCFNFADSIKHCSILDINISKTRARRCFKNITYVNYSNYGNASASGTEIKVEYPSDFIPLSSIPAWTSKQGSTLTYNIGTITSGTGGQITITDSVACVAGITGLTECIKASLSPASNCIPQNPGWDQSSMKVTGNCISGSAHFNITNDGSGNMADSLQYRIYVNDTLIFTGNYKLKSGETLNLDYPAAGQTIRLEADQHALHPGKSRPRVTIENCGIASPEVRNLIITAPQDDLDEETAIACNLIRDSYDPNLKQAFPTGIGAAHNLAPGEEIEYVIHFQNTGTATAYTVTVVDTLDAGLDVASFTQGASSSPYTLSISGKGEAVLTFRFDNINLPDSTTNNLASSGLVSYRMTVPSSAAIGTVIKNKAYIFFDYNAPVITNETMHTVDTITYKDLSKGSAVQIGSVVTGLTGKKIIQAAKIYPNPTTGIITVEMPETGSNSELRIMSLVGVQQKSVPLSSAIQQVSLEGLSQGMYLYEVWQNEERKAGGKLQIWF
jgi:uncharacterized delta-60 repeat protein/uncharacterized repeat protein (TIGR01451 family)